MNETVGIPRCCNRCGRWGNREFRWDAEVEGWICSNDRACRLRVAPAPTAVVPGGASQEETP